MKNKETLNKSMFIMKFIKDSFYTFFLQLLSSPLSSQNIVP